MGESDEKRWCVVGGADKGGILVRTGKETSSPEAESRLATGALVSEVAVEGDRLSFKRLTGEGPDEGWVSIKIKDKVLMERAPVLEPKPASEGREAGIYAEPAPSAPSSRKIRLACLHGTAGTKKVLQTQIAMLTKRLGEDVEFVFIEGIVKCSTSNAIVASQIELMKKFFPNEDFKHYAEPLGGQLGWRTYEGMKDAVDKLQALLKKEAPIDAVLGFSQGSNFAHCLAAQAGMGKGQPFRCVVHLCTSKPGWVGQIPDIFEYQIPIPALVVEAEKDTVATGSDEVAASYEDAQRYKHSDVHRPLPSKPPEANELCDTIKEFLIKHCR